MEVVEGAVIRLEQAAACHRERAEEMKREFFAAGERVINGSALYDQMEGLVVFNSPEYRDPFHPGQGENFLKAVWERIEQSQTPCTEKRRKRWFGR